MNKAESSMTTTGCIIPLQKDSISFPRTNSKSWANV